MVSRGRTEVIPKREADQKANEAEDKKTRGQADRRAKEVAERKAIAKADRKGKEHTESQ